MTAAIQGGEIMKDTSRKPNTKLRWKSSTKSCGKNSALWAAVNKLAAAQRRAEANTESLEEDILILRTRIALSSRGSEHDESESTSEVSKISGILDLIERMRISRSIAHKP